jgi:NADH-quinone oxidoreductase subunit C
MTNETIKQRLTDKFGEQLTEWEEPYGLLTFTAPAEMNLKVMQMCLQQCSCTLVLTGWSGRPMTSLV